MDDISKKALMIKDELTDIRRALHKIPETDFIENKTSLFICSKLDEFRIPYEIKAVTGISAFIKGKNPGKTVLLRADMDGLPIAEESGVDFKSEHEGYMHACGHDIHVTCLLGAAKLLNDMKEHLHGNIRLIFQPAEEGAGGAEPMIKEGVMENPHVDGAFALHVEPLEEVGNIQIREGGVMASPDDFELIVKGVGGHGAYPHKCVNPVLTGAMIVNAYQSITASKISPMTPSVVNVCSFHAGTCRNAVPDKAVITGTARSFDEETRKILREQLENTARGIAQAMGAEIEINYNQLFPPVINNHKMNEIVRKSADELSIVNNVIYLEEGSMAGDDFSYFSNLVPGAYFKLGVGNKNIGAVYPIHSPKFKADEDALPIGAAIMAQNAINFLNKNNTEDCG